MRIKVTLVFLFFCCLYQSYGQDKQPNFHHLTRDNGLSSNRVNCIVEDSQGFMWFGTEDGLNKFNGYDFEVFRSIPNNENSIPANAIDFILEDVKPNNLWIATRKGLVYFDQVHQKFELILSKEIEDRATGNISITSLCIDNNNRLWIGKFNGLFIYDIATKELSRLRLPKSTQRGIYQQVHCIYKDDMGSIWLGGESGLYKYNEKDASFITVTENGLLNSVRVIMQDHNKGFWVGSDRNGLFYYKTSPDDGYTRLFNKENGDFEINRVHEVIEDEPGKFYIVVRDGGLYHYNMNINELLLIKPDIYNSKSINSTALISAYKSSNEMIWVGTYNSGINYIDKAAKKFMHYKVDFRPNGLFNNNIRALYQDSENRIWIGTKENGGLSEFNPKSGSFKNYRKSSQSHGLADDYIFSINELNKNELLIGTFRHGLAVFNKKTQKFRYHKANADVATSIADNRVYCTFKDKQNVIWVGTYNGLQIFNPNKDTFTTIYGIERPRCFIDEDENTLWIGSKEHGLYFYNKTTGKYKNFLANTNASGSLSSNDIYGLAKDKEGNLWIASKQGLDKYNMEKQQFFHFDESDGLPANWVCGLLIDNEDNIWVSTSNGIAKFNPQTKAINRYDIIDGLQGNEFEGYVALKTNDGHMLFGGRNGFNYFLPQEIIDNTKLPEIVLTGFKLYNKDVPINEKSVLTKHISFTPRITLKHYQSAITFNYAALNYTSPEKNKYAYKLIGIDNDWVKVGTKRSAVYTNIPPGEYTFRVKGSNNDNYWNEAGESIEIEVLNPFWKTIWAYIAYVILLAILLYFIRKLLVFRIEQKNLLKIERIEKQQIQELNQMKLRFFTNISHEFRTPLTLINAPLNKLMSYGSNNEEQNYLYKIMMNNVQRMLGLVNELMDFRKAEQGELKLKVSKTDLVELLQQIVECFDSKALERNVDFEFEYANNNNSEECWIDKRLIDKVVFNLLSNAFKYTPQYGKITLDLMIDKENAIIKVVDSGPGIPEELQNNVFDRFYQIEDGSYNGSNGSGIGLAFSRRLIEAHRGSIALESTLGKGAAFKIEFPISKKAFTNKEITEGNTGVYEVIQRTNVESIESPEIKKSSTKKEIRLLIVEDNKEMRSFLQNHFKEYDLLLAENGKVGYKLANKKVPDIIISDVMMPEMDGLEMCKKLKMQFATSHIPIILLTAKTEISHRIEGIDIGADAYIEKPFDVKYLESRVKNLISQRNTLRKRFAEQTDAAEVNQIENLYEKKFMEKAQLIIQEQLSNADFSVEDFGYELGLSRSQLFRKFKSIYELKPSEFIRNERLKASKKMLLERHYNVNEISELVGFKSASYFITSFKKFYGKPPAEFVSKSK